MEGHVQVVSGLRRASEIARSGLLVQAGNEVIAGGRNYKAIDKVDNTMELLVYRGYVSGLVNKVPLFNVTIPEDVPEQGFVGLGTDSYGYADWDFFGLRNASNPISPDLDSSLYLRSEGH